MTNTPVIIGVTGHRKLEHDEDRIRKVFREKLHQYEAEAIVTGMALGFDMLCAEVARDEGIPYIAAVPFRGQTSRWPTKEKERWTGLITDAYKTKVVSSGGFDVWKLFERNRWIVKRSTLMLSYWNGKPKGGTYQCIEETERYKRPHENLFTLCNTK